MTPQLGKKDFLFILQVNAEYKKYTKRILNISQRTYKLIHTSNLMSKTINYNIYPYKSSNKILGTLRAMTNQPHINKYLIRPVIF